MFQCRCATHTGKLALTSPWMQQRAAQIWTSLAFTNTVCKYSNFLLLCECQLCSIFCRDQDWISLLKEGESKSWSSTEVEGHEWVWELAVESVQWDDVCTWKQELHCSPSYSSGVQCCLCLHGVTGLSKALHVSVWPASMLQCVCVHGTISKHAGTICLPCSMHSSACSPSRSMLGLCSPPFVLLC